MSKQECPSCEIEGFSRNHYFNGKLLVERDFTDEQRYYINKARYHNQRMHGWGVVCGLKVKEHPNETCRDRFVCVEPGSAVDCSGHDLVILEEDCIDITTLDSIKALKAQNDQGAHVLQIYLRYKECPTEDIPVLYDDCGCNESKCAPNRILESYEIGVILEPGSKAPPTQSPPFVRQTPPDIVHVSANARPAVDTPLVEVSRQQHTSSRYRQEFPIRGSAPPSEGRGVAVRGCSEILWRHLKGCPHCDQPNYVVLATINDYKVGDTISGNRIDNRADRKVLASTEVLQDLVECMMEHRDSGGVGPQGPPGAAGPQGPPGPPGQGLDLELTHICAINWNHAGVVNSGDFREHGLIVAFDQPVQKIDLTSRSVIVLVPRPADSGEPVCWCELPIKIEGLILDSPCKISGFHAAQTEALVTAVRIKPEGISLSSYSSCRVQLNGDFIRDNSQRALDADHLPPWLNRAGKSGDGIAGGTFESWFTLTN